MKKAKNKNIGDFTSLFDLLQAFPTEEMPYCIFLYITL